MADKWDEAAKNLELGRYGSPPKDPVLRPRTEELETLELEGVSFSETSAHNLTEKVVELIVNKINSMKSAGKENGKILLGYRIGDVVASEPLNICFAVGAKTQMAIGVYGKGSRHVLYFSK